MIQGGMVATYNGPLDIANTYLVRNNGRTFLHCKKAGAGDCLVTVQTPPTVAGLAIAEQTFTVPATTGDIFAGPFPQSIFNDSIQDLKFTCSEITGLTVAVLKL
jgi:hypothetical protein